MLLIWTDEAWDDYLYWQSQDKKTLKRINKIMAFRCLWWVMVCGVVSVG
ncbi:Toxin YoeB [Bifidobacterium breve]|nr:Toxin YoeB [Bifidobacterium breve]